MVWRAHVVRPSCGSNVSTDHAGPRRRWARHRRSVPRRRALVAGRADRRRGAHVQGHQPYRGREPSLQVHSQLGGFLPKPNAPATSCSITLSPAPCAASAELLWCRTAALPGVSGGGVKPVQSDVDPCSAMWRVRRRAATSNSAASPPSDASDAVLTLVADPVTMTSSHPTNTSFPSSESAC